MKKILNLILAIGWLSSYAQISSIAVDWGPVYKAKDLDFQKIIGTHGDHFYTYGNDNASSSSLFSLFNSNDIKVGYFSHKDFKMKFMKEIEGFEYHDKDSKYHSSYVKANGDAVLYFSVYQNKEDKKYLLRRTVSPKGRVGKYEVIASTPAIKKGESNFNIRRSKDKASLLIFANTPYQKRDKENFLVKVFDRDHNLKWEKEITLPYTDKYFSVLNSTITNDGKVFVLGFAEPDRYKGESKERRASNEDYKLFLITEKSNQITEFDLPMDDKFIDGTILAPDFIGDKLVVSGFYTKEYGSRSGIEGSFFIAINQSSLEEESVSFQEFSTDFLKNFMSDRRAEKGRDLQEFKPQRLYRREDGGAVLIAEQRYLVTTTYTTANGATSTSYTYYRNDIIAVSINPEGKIIWQAHVPKNQTASPGAEPYTSYISFIKEDKIHFIFNDDRKNPKRLAAGKKRRTMNNPKKSLVVMSTVDGNGRVFYEPLFSNKDYGAILVPRRCYQIEEGNLILFGQRKKKCRFGTISL